MPLTDAQVRNTRYNPAGTGNRLADGGRMYLQLAKFGAKYCQRAAMNCQSRTTGETERR
ncbi:MULTISPECIES: hypothetical protein [Paraburkholderia]|uniref:hypothetical protein n=1 Tax=Paraburkholderia TaxID=1822464 RepID=UPI00037D6118|nr:MULTISPECIES: hypothetical protein [Paraburkholderia]MDH6150436.1 hypothetical protein [Paraburkholderia sp. WSM4179]